MKRFDVSQRCGVRESVTKSVRGAMVCLVLGLALPLAAAPAPKLVVAIMVDQLRYDYLERFQHQFTTNGFRRLTERGAFMTYAHYDYSPTVTGPGHASVLAGAGPAQHGIIANDWIDKKSGRGIYCVDDNTVTGVGTSSSGAKKSPRNFIGANFADQMRLRFGSKVVGLSIKDRGSILPAGKKPLGAFWFESSSGNFVTSSYYMEKLPAWLQTFNSLERPLALSGSTWERLLAPEAYQYPDDREGEGKLGGENTRTFPHQIHGSPQKGYEDLTSSPYGNQLLMEVAEAAIEGEQLGSGAQPDLLCVSFSSNDLCGHKFGPYSQEVQDITLRLDRQLNEFFNYLDRLLGPGNALIILTADHAVAPLPEFAVAQGLEGRRLNEAILLAELAGALDEAFGPGKYLLKTKVYGGNLYFNHPELKAKNVEPAALAAFIREWLLDTGRYHMAYTREQLLDGRTPGPIGQRILRGYHAERGGDMVLVPKPYQVPSTGTGTTHGSPYGYDAHVPVLFQGPGIKAGRYGDEFFITDIVPTLCVLLGMQEPPMAAGRPMLKILREAP